MRILIVHDRKEVAAELKRVVTETSEALDKCDVAIDYQSARSALAEHLYDLLILDLTLPIKTTIGQPSFENVHALLEELFNEGSLNPPGDIIGITRDEEALRLVENRLGPHLMVTISEDPNGAWKSYLKDKLSYAKRAAKTRALSAARHHDVDALIVTAMDIEMRPYEGAFEMRQAKHFRGATEFAFTDRNDEIRRGVAYSIGKSGQASAASLTQALITFYRPRLAAMSGYCGGVKGKLNLGDLVFFEAAYAWDYGKWEEIPGKPPTTKFCPRPDPIGIANSSLHSAARRFVSSNLPNDQNLVRRVSEASKGKLSGFKIHLKPAASGSAVVAADDIVARIGGLNDSIWAVDMEAYGFYHAAEYTRVAQPDFVCVKAVSDFSNGEKGDELHDACSLLSAEAVVRLLTRYWDFSEKSCTIN